MKNEKIAFIGTGVMGASIVKHLVNASYDVTVYTRTKSKADPLVELGVRWADSVGEAVREADIIFTMIGMPADVEEVYLSENGIFANGRPSQTVVDMTTSSPELAIAIARKAESLQMHSLDAPVSGGDIGAQNGTLSIMCGGKKALYDRLLPILSVFGKQIVYQGDAGAGQHAKMCNQITVAGNMIGACEALAYAMKSGLDPDTMLQSVASGAAGSWSLSALGPRIIEEDYEPGFFVKHFVKDLNIALQETERLNLELPGLKLARKMYIELLDQGYGEKGTQVLIKQYID
ncbi:MULTISPECIES: NAD(P)-dependent oxidoreductase [Sporosarcina]|uniref:3-hydroxyisobutyrate dehydrogenase n=1 Tax=Sporosarcina newyorkensis TaxID=759851 RepID=A0A1T4YHK5_9BACL|nr:MULTISPECIES: NAD(P)-dependent oxidoreductase [Sporosarcina]MBY0222980.1 NAD(P)-dependent oxidoreductase [Sporosarcina aquimarina]SKB00705.1 3-hydroxyisobutyrate dehydrogenase [Sporosarcina newyorkensis]